MNVVKTVGVLLVLALLGGSGFIYSGSFDVAADVPHSPFVVRLIEFARERGIKTQAKHVLVPRLDDPRKIAEGGSHYDAMCVGCHLAPGKSNNEFRQGLYPQPPDLSKQTDTNPAEAFWVIKHGLKMTAMPAWGMTHDDETIWAMVAFLRKLPSLTPEQYVQMTEHASEEHSHDERRDSNKVGGGKGGTDALETPVAMSMPHRGGRSVPVAVHLSAIAG